MITLITGTPGSGKSAYALDMMIRQGRLNNSRKLYVHGIPELKVPHEIVTCESATCDYCSTLPISKTVFIHVPKKPPSWATATGLSNSLDLTISSDSDLVEKEIKIEYKKAEDWHLFAEHGAILFFDEVQNIHRPRNSSSVVPPSIAAYEVHRHRGLDFFMITQNPSLIDGNIRALVSRHIHLTSSWARRIQYEFPQCKTDLGATVGEGIKSNYILPKDVFSLYKSASLHTKLDRKKPFIIYLIPVFIFSIAGMSYYEYNRLTSKSFGTSSKVKSEKIDKNTVSIGKNAAGGEGASAAQAVRVTAPPDALTPERVVLDMPRLFKTWSQVGIADDDLKFLPIHMCSVSSARFVKCKFPANLSFKHFFNNVSCSPDFCFSFINRIPPVIDDNQQRNFTTPPPLVPSVPSVASASTVAAN